MSVHVLHQQTSLQRAATYAHDRLLHWADQALTAWNETADPAARDMRQAYEHCAEILHAGLQASQLERTPDAS